MAAGKSELAKQISAWLASLTQAADHESWGQPVEASELYKKLGKSMRTTLTSDIQISDAAKRELAKLSASLEHRAQLAADPTNVLESSQLADMKSSPENILSISVYGCKHCQKLSATSVLEDLQAGKEVTCHIATNSPVKIQQSELVIDGGDDDDDDDNDKDVTHNAQGNLLSPPLYIPGRTYLTIKVHKIGIKDPHNYIDPFIEISIKDSATNDCETIQQTPVSHCREVTYFVYDVDVHIQTPIEDMPAGAGIFFEFKHYKPKKERISTRCFSFMELDEIRDGPISLEIYKKPTDFRKKKLFLLSIKPLYLHLKLLLNKPLV